jgi:hypothetical protein
MSTACFAQDTECEKIFSDFFSLITVKLALHLIREERQKEINPKHFGQVKT